MAGHVLIFDSGVGGLTVARAVCGQLAGARLTYVADSAGFPYGPWPESRLIQRICHVVERAVGAYEPDVVVVACNTASTIALEALRARFEIPFVGTVPAIKTAAEKTSSGLIGVLATPGTASRVYTRTLIHTYAYHCRVFLHGAEHLAGLAEAKLRGEAVAGEAIAREIAPVFKERGGKRTDTVVLGCTHYPLLVEEMAEAAPWPVSFIDPAEAIARQAGRVLDQSGSAGRTGAPGDDCEPVAQVIFTSNAAANARFAKAFGRYGFAASQVLDLPL